MRNPEPKPITHLFRSWLIGFGAELRIVGWIVEPNRTMNLNKTNMD